MRAPRLLMAAVVVLAGSMAAGLSTGQTTYVDPQVTQCHNCHAPGLWSPPMNPIYAVFASMTTAEVGEVFELQGQLLNTWKSDTLWMYVTLDISRAPSLRFASDKDPYVAEPVTGTIPGGPTALQGEQRGAVRVQVPEGATDLRITLAPDQRDPNTAPDLRMLLYDTHTNYPSSRPSATVNERGKGQDEVFQVSGAGTIAQHGYGNWTVEAAYTPLSPAPSIDAQVAPVGFSVTVEAWFNATEETQQVAYKANRLQPGSRQLFTWRVTLVDVPGANERVELIANATTHYNHSGSEPDWENMTINGTAPVRLRDDGRAQVGIELQGTLDQGPVLVGVSMAAISEAIGYGATFLLVTSIYTGGIFGKSTRRQLNVVFGSARRRVAFHNFLSYGIIAASIAHMVIFVWDTIEPNYPWQLGLIWGGLAILCMLGLGITGALQVPMIRRWNYGTWRWTHFALAIGAILFTLVHMALDGTHFHMIQDAVGWRDPLVPESRQV